MALCPYLRFAIAVALAGCASQPDGPVMHASPAPRGDTTTCPLLNPVQRVNPAFPRSMIRERREGWVIVGFDVLPGEGRPRNVHVVSSDPGGVFDAEALRALAASRFAVDKPYTGCQSVFEFHLR